MFNNKKYAIMKRVYVIYSITQEDHVIFSSRKKAEAWLENYNKEIFDKSQKDDLYICPRMVF